MILKYLFHFKSKFKSNFIDKSPCSSHVACIISVLITCDDCAGTHFVFSPDQLFMCWTNSHFCMLLIGMVFGPLIHCLTLISWQL